MSTTQNKSITLVTSEATNHISRDLRNNIYSALLSGDGIRNIEATLDRQLAESGFKDELRRYVTELFRTGQATSVDEAKGMAMERIRSQMDEGKDGVNGRSNGYEGEYGLKIPRKAVVEGTRSVRRELEKVCEITED